MTLQSTDRHVKSAYGRSCLSVSVILRPNLSHFTMQYQPYCAVKWLKLNYKMTDIVQ